MILNERQYRASRASIRRFEDEISDLNRDAGKHTPEQRDLLVGTYTGQIADIERELAEFDAVRSGQIQVEPIASFEDLRLALIRARIARGWTQKQLAEALGVSEQQVQKDEMNRYASVGIDRLQTIAEALGLDIRAAVRFPDPESGNARESDIRERWRKPMAVMLVQRQAKQWNSPIGGHLVLQKLLLLLDSRVGETLGWNAFQFEPYLYGPFDLELEDDVAFLSHNDFITVRVRSGLSDELLTSSDERQILIAPGPKAEGWVNSFLVSKRLDTPATKERVLGIVDEIVTEYGNKPRSELLRIVYERFPHLTRRSTIRDEVIGHGRTH